MMASKKNNNAKNTKNNSRGRIANSRKRSEKKPGAKRVVIPVVAFCAAVVAGLLLGVIISKIRTNNELDKIISESSYGDENTEDSGENVILNDARLREIQELAKHKAEEKANALRQEEIAELEKQKAAITKQYTCNILRDSANVELDTAYTTYNTKMMSCARSMSCKADDALKEYNSKVKEIKEKYNNQLKSQGCNNLLY